MHGVQCRLANFFRTAAPLTLWRSRIIDRRADNAMHRVQRGVIIFARRPLALACQFIRPVDRAIRSAMHVVRSLRDQFRVSDRLDHVV